MLCPQSSDGVPQGRLGIATLHYGYNEGAVLQAYCVAARFRKLIPELIPEIVDHRYPAKQAVYGVPNDERKAELLRAIDGWLPLSTKHTHADDHRGLLEYLSTNYRAIVVGSDVVWRCAYKSRLFGLVRVQSGGFVTPFPNLYWPDETVRIPRIAYATSVGPTDWRHIPTSHRRRMHEILAGFGPISVRDRRTLRFLEWLSPNLAARAAVVPDPTLCVDLLDKIDKSALRERLEESGVDFRRPRCGVVAGDYDAPRSTAEELRKVGYQILGITTRNNYSDVPLFHSGFHPLEWAALFGCVDFCISERMHACIFCLLNKTPFVAIDINESADDPNTKLQDLLGSLGLEEYCIPRSKATPAVLGKACEKACASPWDWDAIHQGIGVLRSYADTFLSDVRSYLGFGSRDAVAVGELTHRDG